MKKCCLIFGICLCAIGAQAQFFTEWFRQKATQRKYLTQQIVMLQGHLLVLKKGYDIARDGIGLVDQLKNKEFNLHDIFFTGLKTVSPAIRDGTTVSAILQSLARATTCLSSHRGILRSPGFAAFRQYDVLQVDIEKRLAQLERFTVELLTLITSGNLELSDDQRIQRLEALLQQSRQLESSARKSEQSSKLLLMQYQREAAELQYLRQLHNF